VRTDQPIILGQNCYILTYYVTVSISGSQVHLTSQETGNLLLQVIKLQDWNHLVW